MTVTLGFDVEEFDFPLERGRGIDFGTQLAVSSEGWSSCWTCSRGWSCGPRFTRRPILPSTARTLSAASSPEATRWLRMTITTADRRVGPCRQPADARRADRTAHCRLPCPAAGRRFVRGARGGGYRYNSSINPTWIPTRYNNLRAPCSVSREEGLTIYPVSVSAPFRVPLFWISLHVMPLPLYKLLCRSALRRDGHLNLYFHPWEFSARLRETGFRCSGLSYALFGDGPATEIHPAAGVAESPRLSVFDHPRIPRMR